MRHDRCCFGRLGQEDQRLKKHYGRWMYIIDHARREHQGGGRRRGLGRGRRGSGSTRREDYEGPLVRLWCEAAIAAGPGRRWE